MQAADLSVFESRQIIWMNNIYVLEKNLNLVRRKTLYREEAEDENSNIEKYKFKTIVHHVIYF